MRSVLSILAVGFLAGCTDTPSNDGSDPGHNLDTACTSGCETDAPMAQFIGPPVLFNGVEEVTTTNLAASEGDAKYSVQTGDEEDVQATTYTAKFGDQALASAASDNLPLITLANGWLAISPPVEGIVVEAGDEPTEPDAPSVNLFAQGTWTCDTNNGADPLPETVGYAHGDTLTLPRVGTLTVSGMSLSYSADGVEQEGQFLSNTLIEVSSVGGMAGDYNADCWLGTPSQDPR